MVLWGQLASFACSYPGKGRLVYIEGRLQSRQWQVTDGSTQRNVEIVAKPAPGAHSKSASAAFPQGLVPEGALPNYPGLAGLIRNVHWGSVPSKIGRSRGRQGGPSRRFAGAWVETDLIGSDGAGSSMTAASIAHRAAGNGDE